ncbi:MAG: hypothetical protein LCH47_03230 [Proteobacteria bacterium]|nr:hypothetical protein [Pseudomonadota bacterium]
MNTNMFIAVMVGVLVNAVVFGLGAVAILAIPEMAADAKYLLPGWIIFTFLISPFITLNIFPRLRLRYWRARGKHGDAISG